MYYLFLIIISCSLKPFCASQATILKFKLAGYIQGIDISSHQVAINSTLTGPMHALYFFCIKLLTISGRKYVYIQHIPCFDHLLRMRT